MDDLSESECSGITAPPLNPPEQLNPCETCGRVSRLNKGLCVSCVDHYKPVDHVRGSDDADRK